MWLIVLSDQLPVVALVGRYPTNKLIGREPLPERKPISSPGHAARWGHPVLAPVSRCYPGLRGRLLTCYSPVRHSAFPGVATGWTSFDLHVLGTPPAFVLSQDQTLHRDLVPRRPDDPAVGGFDLESRHSGQAPRATGTARFVVRDSAKGFGHRAACATR